MKIKNKIPKNILPITDEAFIALSLPLLRCFFTGKASIDNEQSIFGFLIWAFSIYFMCILGRQCSNSLYKSNILSNFKIINTWLIYIFVENLVMILYCGYSIFLIRNIVGNYFDINLYVLTACAIFMRLTFEYAYRIGRSSIINIKNNLKSK